MTRLTSDDLWIPDKGWQEYDHRMQELLGVNLTALAARALQADVDEAVQALGASSVAAVPISSGEGIITGFAEALADIARHMGCRSFVTLPDQAGFAEARDKKAAIRIWADDDNFFTERQTSDVRAENGRATGIGFAAALDLLCAGVSEKRVLVLGCGPVGSAAAKALAQKKARLWLCDTQTDKAHELAQSLRHECGCTAEALAPKAVEEQAASLDAVFDAAPYAAQGYALPKNIPVSAPAVPCLWPHSKRIWHDPLQTGTAVMLLAAALNMPLE